MRMALLTGLSMVLNGEFFAHGFGLINLPILFLFYLLYVTIIDNLIALFQLTDRQIFFIGASFGLLIEAFFHRSFYSPPPLFLGVNWGSVVLQTIAWGLMATVMAFYISARLLPRRTEGPGNPFRIAVLLVGTALMLAIFVVWGNSLPPLSKPGAPLLLVPIAVLLGLFVRNRRRADNRPLTRENPVIDRAAQLYLLMEAIIGTLVRPIGSPAFALSLALLGPVIYFSTWRRKRLPV